MVKSIRVLAGAFAALSIALIFQNCGQPGSISATPALSESASGVVTPVVTDTYGITVLNSSKFICEPFGNTNGGDSKAGLKAELAYIDPQSNLSTSTKNNYQSIDYFGGGNEFIQTTTPIYLSQINVPTRKFDQGFLLSDGTYLVDQGGNKLIEYFALKMKSLLKLSPADEEGDYELATISDDGSRLLLNLGYGDQEVIVNDGAHSTRMRCANDPVTLSQNSKIPMTYYYNQGPRYEIANVLIWRKKPANSTTGKYPLCGVSGGFWNASDSTPASNWTQLQNDGWKVVGADNFELQDNQVNPCATQNTNLISQVSFSALQNGQSTLNLGFSTSANIVAKLYKVMPDNSVVLIQTFDFSSQVKDSLSLALQSLENGATYTLEVQLEMPNSGTQVLNEVKFQVQKQ